MLSDCCCYNKTKPPKRDYLSWTTVMYTLTTIRLVKPTLSDSILYFIQVKYSLWDKLYTESGCFLTHWNRKWRSRSLKLEFSSAYHFIKFVWSWFINVLTPTNIFFCLFVCLFAKFPPIQLIIWHQFCQINTWQQHVELLSNRLTASPENEHWSFHSTFLCSITSFYHHFKSERNQFIKVQTLHTRVYLFMKWPSGVISIEYY